MSELFSLQGRVYTADRTGAGTFENAVWLGNVPEATLELETETSDKFESFSGNRLLYGSLQKSKQVNFTMRLDEFLPSSIELGLYGTTTTVAGAVVASETLPSGLVAGDTVRTAHPFISAVSVKDSTGSPLTLVAGSDYEVTNATIGLITILDPTGFIQPLKVAYTYESGSAIVLFATPTPPERYVLFSGINTINGDLVEIEIYRMMFNPVTDFGLINEDWGGFQLSGKALYDEQADLNAALGGFGRLFINKTYD